MGDVKDLNDRKKSGTLPADPANETVRVKAPYLRLVGDAEREPPPPATDIYAERAICASLLWAATYAPGTARLSTIADVIEPKMFWEGQNKAIIKAVIELEENNRVAEVVSVRSEAARQRTRVEIEYLQELVECAVAPSDIKLRQWAELVRDAWLRRRIIEAAEAVIVEAESGHRSARDVMQSATTAFEKVGADVAPDATLVSMQQAAVDVLRAMDSTEAEFIPTGMRDVDAMIGGLFQEDVSILAARTSVGKSAIATTWAETIAQRQSMYGVLYATLEMPAKQFVNRRAAAHARVDLSKIRRKTWSPVEQKRVSDALIELAKIENLAFVDSNVQTCASLSTLVLQHQARLAKSGKRIGLFVIDHIHLIKPDAANENLPRRDQMAAVSRWMRAVSRTMKCHVLGLAQISRESERQGKDTRPMPHMIKESGAFEEDANNVFLLHRKRRKSGGFVDEPAEFIVAKARNDLTGTAQLFVEPKYCIFKDCESMNVPASRQYVQGSYADADAEDT